MQKVLIAGLFLLIPGLSQPAGTSSLPDQEIVYKTTPQGDLKLYVFPDTRAQASPAIVFFHGGSWNSGGPSQFFKQSRYLAKRGMTAICAEYRLCEKHHTTPVECVKDAKSAMRWVRAHAKELKIDPDRLAAGGGSAGGHLAAATAFLPGLNDEKDDLTVSCKPGALVLFNPVIDNGPDGFGYSRVSEYWKDFSPLHNISSALSPPPTLFMLGTEDQLIPVSTEEKFKKCIEDADGQCELILYDGQKHGFFNSICFQETIKATDEFLTSIGYLPSR